MTMAQLSRCFGQTVDTSVPARFYIPLHGHSVHNAQNFISVAYMYPNMSHHLNMIHRSEGTKASEDTNNIRIAYTGFCVTLFASVFSWLEIKTQWLMPDVESQPVHLAFRNKNKKRSEDFFPTQK